MKMIFLQLLFQIAETSPFLVILSLWGTGMTVVGQGLCHTYPAHVLEIVIIEIIRDDLRTKKLHLSRLLGIAKCQLS